LRYSERHSKPNGWYPRVAFDENDGKLEADFGKAKQEWFGTSDIASTDAVAHPVGTPVLFTGTSSNWKESEAVELIELRPRHALVVSHRQIEAAEPGSEVDLYQVPIKYFKVQRPGLWWLPPVYAIAGARVNTFTVQRARRSADVLTEIRNWHGGDLSPQTPSPWRSCSNRLANLKDIFIDELSLYVAH
jgi:hypothetical protein